MTDETNLTTNLANNSGEGKNSPVLDIVSKKFNWGAFWCSWIWGLCNKSYLTLIIIPTVFLGGMLGSIAQLCLAIWFGVKGNTWAWQNKKWESVEHFHSVQKRWAAITSIIIGFFLVLGILIALVMPSLTTNTSEYRNKAVINKSLKDSVQIVHLQEALGEKCELTSDGLAKCFEKRMYVKSLEGNKIITEAGPVEWEFTGNGRCKQEGDCSIKVTTKRNSQELGITIPLYSTPDGYLKIKAKDVKKIQTELGY